MKMWAYFTKAVLVYPMAGLCVVGLASSACAEGAVDPDAQSVLVSMSN
jgi:hypothetical protein